MPALEILAATLLVLGSAIVLHVLVEADRLDSPAAANRPEPESAEPETLRRAA